jgi:polysaccharide pyruvyl transferase WcaK-like protein
MKYQNMPLKKSASLETRPVITVGLLWHSISSDNLGVGALTESQIAICQAAAVRAGVDVNYLIFGTTGGKHYPPPGVPIHIGSRISIKQILLGNSPFLKELDQCDLILDIGEGDSFADIYGIKRFIFLIVSKIAVLAKRKPLILSPQTIGPFDHWLPRKLATAVMRRCTQVFARDGLSSNYLAACGVKGNTTEVIDVAFRLPFTRPAVQATNKVQIGINVSGLLFSGGYTEKNQFGLTLEYPNLIRELLREWTNDPQNEVWLIPHVIPDEFPIEDDRIAIDSLLNEFPNAKRAPNFNSPSEAKSFIAGMEFMTGARMHACIAAFSTGVPVVPLAYSRKFNGLFSSLNYPWVADGKSMNTSDAFKMIMDGYNKRELLKNQIADGNQTANRLLQKYEDYIALCMSGKCP